jgi:hypothetical protein
MSIEDEILLTVCILVTEYKGLVKANSQQIGCYAPSMIKFIVLYLLDSLCALSVYLPASIGICCNNSSSKGSLFLCIFVSKTT